MVETRRCPRATAKEHTMRVTSLVNGSDPQARDTFTMLWHWHLQAVNREVEPAKPSGSRH